MRQFLATLILGLASTMLTSSASGQSAGPALVVTTIPLRYLESRDAAKLVEAYVQSPKGMVSVAGANIRAITVRETADVTKRIEVLLREQDRARPSVQLRFQLIRASDSLLHDPAIVDLDTELRNILRFKGYQLNGEAVTIIDELNEFKVGLNERMVVEGQVFAIDPQDGHVQLRVFLTALPVPGAIPGRVINTGLTIPRGQTVVLGTTTSPNGTTYVLAVRAERIAK